VAKTSPDNPVSAYARAVVEERIVTNRLVRLAWERHLEDLVHGGVGSTRMRGAARRGRVIDLPICTRPRVLIKGKRT
jgi:hypothetical protein